MLKFLGLVCLISLVVWGGWLVVDAIAHKDNAVATIAICDGYSGEKSETCKKDEEGKPKSAETVSKAINAQN
ncbi:hypothetical protein C1Y08_25140 [Pseudomonas sp. FW306-02-F02-AA]|uniref:Uncharacterized protein n=1 Tax=Pseudomonas fluorescens TaxID=294 RepID=A0A0N7H0X6_PSEFL|nr:MULTISPECIES: hypothetical protein [Pseudomonas]ALI04364.1 hypothetical protein AO353_26090 [Pseudomonas fluorescens]PMZ01620.1 hypothetical protein C1Y07_23975 [Pseudomonas sp. FW306-02-F02-AB]PMZ10169.1 hypothetical protein C1Y06_11135 [Pseudomonas sp. FW306-02-H06C]PMZ13228.1 hypothetical protein C1Y08_25140 [Pseudomonas sp. FW306-02-F02-AA]PMZ19271.1 hypothetical protein C1Y09_25205 [Pseudomonas sp. FW306-02-F08-AA]